MYHSHDRRRLLVPVALALLLMPGEGLAQRAEGAGAPPFIETIGTAEGRAAPDRATLSLSVESKGPSAAAVATVNARLQRLVLDTLAALGFRAPAVSTRSFNVAPNYEVGPQGRRQEGYVARNAVMVRLTDLTRIGALIDAALARGATGVGDLAFGSSAADSAGRAATREAVTRARAEAEAIADAMGGTLGPLLQATTSPVSVAAYGRFGYEGIAGGRVEGSTSITPTDVIVRSSVVARWQYLPRR